MANGNATPGAVAELVRGDTKPPDVREFNADERAKVRDETPVTIGGRKFKRKRKVWDVSREVRKLQREQESAVAKSMRLRTRLAELEADQLELAAKGDEDGAEAMEEQINKLVEGADTSTEDAERVTYKIIEALLVPFAEDGPPAELDHLLAELDVNDAGALARDLTGSREPDPQATPSSSDIGD